MVARQSPETYFTVQEVDTQQNVNNLMILLGMAIFFLGIIGCIFALKGRR